MTAPLLMRANGDAFPGDGLPALELAGYLDEIGASLRAYHEQGQSNPLVRIDWLLKSGETVRVIVEPAR